MSDREHPPSLDTVERGWTTDTRPPGLTRTAAGVLGLGMVEQREMLDQVRARLFGGDAEPGMVGRFQILERLGSGGMGVVYLGLDPDLDRKVALKLLHPRLLGRRSLEQAQRRMRMEARAMARLVHPNVVNIHEVGTHGGQLFLAMEYVDGEDLGMWLASGRGWREILGIFCQAGEGLDAAHRAGLVHRDFKPENVLVSKSGAVKVTDFGVATLLEKWGELLETADDRMGASITGAALSSSMLAMTKTGALVGTPLFMSPEQFLSEPADARSDQFSFCVALRRALLDDQPFGTGDLDTLSARVVAGELSPRPKDTVVPSWVLDVIERGLATDPGERWPSMTALMEALATDPVARRRRRWAIGGTVLAFGLVGVATGFAAAGQLREPTPAAAKFCDRVEQRLDGVWDEDRRAQVVDAVAGLESGRGDPLVAAFDRYAAEWTSAAVGACEDGRDPTAPLHAMAVPRAECLDQRRVELRELVGVVLDSEVDDAFVRRAEAAADGLIPAARCGDEDYLGQSVPRSPRDAIAAEVEDLRVQFARAVALQRTGSTEAGLALAEQAAERAADLEYRPILAEARVVLARALVDGEPNRAQRLFRAAYLDGEASGHGHVVREAGVRRIQALLQAKSVDDELLDWAGLVEAKLEHRGDALEWAMFHCAMVQVRNASGDHEAARTLGEACLQRRVAALGDDHVEVAAAHVQLAHTLMILAEYDDGIRHAEAAIAIAESKRAPYSSAVIRGRRVLAQLHHAAGDLEAARALYAENCRQLAGRPTESMRLADELMTLADVLVAMDHNEDARVAGERALAIHTRELGDDHIRVAADMATLASAEASLGEYDRARELLEQAIAIAERSDGHDLEATIFTNRLGVVELGAGDAARAEGLQRRALARAEALLGPDNANLRYFVRDLAEAQIALGELDAAQPLLERALQLSEQQVGVDSVATAESLSRLANLELGREQLDEAEAHARRAIALWEVHGDARQLARDRLTLAKVLWARGDEGSRADARAEVESAREDLAATDDPDETTQAELDGWLAAR